MSDPADGIVSVYAVFADDAEAARIGRDMIEAGLAACVNILSPCRSLYRWQGGIEEAQEVPAIFKTAAATTDALIAAIVAAHSYDVPAVVAWPIAAAHPAYREWVEAESGS